MSEVRVLGQVLVLLLLECGWAGAVVAHVMRIVTKWITAAHNRPVCPPTAHITGIAGVQV